MSEQFAAIAGTVETSTFHEITGVDGEHLQFYVDAAQGQRYQVDVNIQSSDGTPVAIYVASGNLNTNGVIPDIPFGTTDYQVYLNASLSYTSLGLTNSQFVPTQAAQIQEQLSTALSNATFAVIWGLVFDNGGPNGKGIHETHFDANRTNQDGAIAIYGRDSANNPIRTWYFFIFSGDEIPVAQS